MKGRIPRKVVQLDYESNEVIAIHNSIADATNANEIASEQTIRQAFRYGKGTLSKYKLKFKWYEQGDSSKFKQKAVRMVDEHTKDVIETYESVADAAYDNFIKFTDLYAALINNNGQINGMKFEYVS